MMCWRSSAMFSPSYNNSKINRAVSKMLIKAFCHSDEGRIS